MQGATLNYILGLDVGIASVGWAVVEIDKASSPVRLIDVGVRTFEKAEVPKNGESLAAARRGARSIRRLVRRRRFRLLKAKRLLKKEGILTSSDFTSSVEVQGLPINCWELRVRGLTQRLSNKEWAAVLLHLLKHRGYLSQRRSERQSDNKELGALLSGVNQNHQLLQKNEFATPAELAIKQFLPQEGRIRNHAGQYSHTFSRLDLKTEMQLLFKQQRLLGSTHASAALEESFVDLLMWQKPALSGEAILRMLGKCTFEPAEYKAAKNTYSAEYFVWLTKLNNLRITVEGATRALDNAERQFLLKMPFEKNKVTYAQVRKVLSLPDGATFNGLRYQKNNPESSTLMEMKAWHTIRKALEKRGLVAEWEGLKTQPVLLDAIGTAFSLYKTDEDIRTYLQDKITEEVIDALLEDVSFDKFIQLSLAALYKIIPLMEKGLRYDEACHQIYGNHYGQKVSQKSTLLPPVPADDIRNPVVLRALSQTRKVINAIVRKYGTPNRVHIETGRELGKSFKERQEIEKRQKENQAERERAVQRFKELFPNFIGEPRGRDILKLRLYEQQQGKCLYSEENEGEIDIHKLFEEGYVEIDHALPMSKTWDDSYFNKVLVLKKENQNKGNKTPYEWFDGESDSERWRNFVARVRGCNFPLAKKQRLLKKEIEDGFKEKNINDTRYIARYLCQFIEENMLLGEKEGKKHVFASNGQITAFLRNKWGIKKVRENNDRHHAIDAIVVACSTVSMQQKITRHIQQKEKGEYIDKSTGEVKKLHFPKPWPHFDKDISIRVFNENPAKDLKELLPDYPERHHAFVSPLFVSRAPTRKMSGQGHMETIKSAKRLAEGIGVVKVRLTQLSVSDLDNMVNREREPELYQALKDRLEFFDGKADRAFAEPFYKKGGQRVDSIKVEVVQKSGVSVYQNRGVADNATMVRIDIFLKNKKYFIVPVYAWHIAKGILPNKAAVSGKDESEWEEMDEHAQFLFSLYPNDLIELVTKKETFFGYYSGFDRSTASIAIKEHDLEKTKGKVGLHRGLGVKTAISLEKYHIDVLGKEIHRCKHTKRQSVMK